MGTVIGYGVTRPARCGLSHIVGPVSVDATFTTMGAICGRPQSKWKVVNGWGDLYHNYATPQEAAAQRPPTCPKCAEYV